MSYSCDIIVFGGGIAGLFTAARLKRAGFNPLLIEKGALGGTQTLASQGMIHGGQKYALGGGGKHAETIAAMPARWEACFAGKGELDLSSVKALSDSQVMFPAGNLFSSLSVFAAAQAVRGRMTRFRSCHFPASVRRGPAYGMQEKVLDAKSLVAALAQNLKGRIFQGDAQSVSPDGDVTVSGVTLKAQAVVFAAGLGNEEALRLLGVQGQLTQRRPLRQVMVRTMESALYGHGIWNHPKPRVTVTSHSLGNGGYVWYLGGNLAEEGAKMDEAQALRFAQKEMRGIFPHLGWEGKEWASLLIDRAEPFDVSGQLPPGPHIYECGKAIAAWPAKLTFAPALADLVLERLKRNAVTPAPSSAPPLPPAETGFYPWEEAAWQRL